MREQPEFFWMIVGSLIISNIFLYIFGMSGIRIFSKVVEIPKSIIVPIILVLSVVGSYAINHNVADVYWMIAFGVLGYFMKMYDYPLAPMVLGVILSPLIESNFRRAMALSHGNVGDFLLSIVTSPLSASLLAFTVIMLVSQQDWKTLLVRWKKRPF